MGRATRTADDGYRSAASCVADQAALVRLVEQCAAISDPSDGVIFEPTTISVEPISDATEYVGTRIRLHARLDNVRQTVQIDFGVGDAVHPPLASIASWDRLDIGVNVNWSFFDTIHSAMSPTGELNERMTPCERSPCSATAYALSKLLASSHRTSNLI